MKKRILAGMLSFALMFTMATPGFAAEITTSLYQKELKDLAYMDIETADPALESKILEARNEIVLNTSWVNVKVHIERTYCKPAKMDCFGFYDH